MKLYEILPVFEARAKPELNPQISSVDQLRQYKDDPNVYISFTHVNKVGIYPLAEDGETPIGIYAFPLQVCWKQYSVDINNDFSDFPHIAHGKPYIQVIKWSGKQKFVNVRDYTHFDLSDDINKLNKMFDAELVEEKLSELNQQPNAFGKLYWLIYKLVDTDYRKWNFVLQKLGYSGFNDINGDGAIHFAEPYQTVFFSSDAITRVDSIVNRFDKDDSQKQKLADANPKELTYREIMQMVTANKQRIQKFEPYILRMKDPYNIMRYMQAANFFSEWAPAEDILATNARTALWYARDVLHRRFIKGEKEIKTHAYLWDDYKAALGIKTKN